MLNLYRVPPTFIVQSALHFATSRTVHANTITTTIEAFSHTATAARKLHHWNPSADTHLYIELRKSGVNEIGQASKWQRGTQTRVSRLTVRHSNRTPDWRSN